MTAGRNAGAEQLRAFMSEKLGTRHSLSYEDRRTALDAVSAVLNPVPDTIQRSSESLEGIDAERFRPSDEVESRVILYLHGGAFVAGSSRSHAILTANLAKHARAQVYSVNYSLAPEHPFPAAVKDCVAAYHSLLNLGHSSSQIAVAGDSAGGALALNLALVLRDAGHPLPASIALISPATDLSQSGQSYRDFADRDPFMSISGFGSDIEAYLGEADRSLGSASPLSADLSGLPPLLIHVGSEEMLLVGLQVAVGVFDELTAVDDPHAGTGAHLQALDEQILRGGRDRAADGGSDPVNAPDGSRTLGHFGEEGTDERFEHRAVARLFAPLEQVEKVAAELHHQHLGPQFGEQPFRPAQRAREVAQRRGA